MVDSIYGSGKLSPEIIDDLVRAAVETLLWSETTYLDFGAEGESWEPLDTNYGFWDVAETSIDNLRDELIVFVETNWDDANLWADTFGWDYFAHDFILTRNGHGTGYWDRFYGSASDPMVALGQRLTDNVKAYGNIDAYVGDDGKVYFA